VLGEDRGDAEVGITRGGQESCHIAVTGRVDGEVTAGLGGLM
jgi:hypothetical protein